MRKKYGADFYLKDRPRKHRYVYFIGTRAFRRDAARSLRYAQVKFCADQWGGYALQQEEMMG